MSEVEKVNILFKSGTEITVETEMSGLVKCLAKRSEGPFVSDCETIVVMLEEIACVRRLK